jgi:putative hydrolase of the HAD superfamily
MPVTLPLIRGIIFDLDGTLYRMPWFFRPLMFFRLFPYSLRLPRFISVRETFAGQHLGTHELIMHAVAAKLGEREKTDAAGMRRWIEGSFYPAFIWVMRFMRHSRPGINELLNAVRAKGINVGLISDYSRVRERLARLDISDSAFDPILSSEESGALKPSSVPYEITARQWAIAPEHILVIGDRMNTDGLAAKNAGMAFLQVGSGKTPAVHSWGDVAEILLNLPHPG